RNHWETPMTLENTLLQRLSEWRPTGDGRHNLAVLDDAARWTLTLTADRQDQIGCVLWELALRRTRPVPAADPAAALRAWAERTAKQVKGLLETLSVVEVDAGRNEALLRSGGPARRGESVSYYEVRLKGTSEALVQRFKGATNGGKRTQVPFTLTHEVLAQLVADLTDDE